MFVDAITARSCRIPTLGLGTSGLHGKVCLSAVEDALAIGYRHIDTAQMYDNEADVGEALQNAKTGREQVFLTTKVWPTNVAAHRFIPSVEVSLRKLKTEYVDLLLLHWPAGPETNDRSADLLAKCLDRGYARAIGVSNFTVPQLENALARAPLVCNQLEYHAYLSQDVMLAYLKREDMFLTAYRPLALGKLREDETLRRIAAQYQKTVGQVALRWLIQQGQVAVIPKASSAAHQMENFALSDFSLSEEDMRAIFALPKDRRLTSPAFAPDWDET